MFLGGLLTSRKRLAAVQARLEALWFMRRVYFSSDSPGRRLLLRTPILTTNNGDGAGAGVGDGYGMRVVDGVRIVDGMRSVDEKGRIWMPYRSPDRFTLPWK